MNIKTMLKKLNYPYKRSAMRYLLREPGLTLPVMSGFSNSYFLSALNRINQSKTIKSFQNLLPGKFCEYLQEKKYVDKDGMHLLLYALVRYCKPDVFVETGVSHGASSAFILAAMEENQKGHLYSIDLPPYEITSGDENGKQIL